MISRLRQLYGNLRIRNKIFIGFTVLVLISTQSVSLYAGYAVRASLEQQISDSVTNILESVASRIDDQFANMEQMVLLFTRNNIIYSSLDGYSGYDVFDKYDRWRAIYNMIAAWTQSQDISMIRLYLSESLLFLRDGIQFIIDTGETASLERVLSTAGNVTYRKNDDGTISVFSGIFSSRTMKRLAIVEFIFNASSIKEQLRATMSATIETVYLMAADGAVFITEQNDIVRETIYKNMGRNNIKLDIIETDSNYIAIYCPLKTTPITLVALLPSDYITRLAEEASSRIWIVGVAILGVAFVIAWLISSGITHRLELLKQAMNSFESGEITTASPQDYRDELGTILTEFKNMRVRLDIITHERYQATLLQKETDFRLLQAQINPHFLYNTLDVIACTASAGEMIETEWLVRQLSSFMRLSITKSGEWSTIRRELNQVQSYWNIQNYRFKDCILLEIKVTGEILGEKMMPMLLQPLVENALKHGILPTETQHGLIELEIKANKHTLIITVTDDGVGIPPAKLSEIKSSLMENGNGSFGLWNIHQRIRNHYGEPYGLEITSSIKGCTCFSLAFPRD